MSATVYVKDVRIESGSNAATVSTDSGKGLYYAVGTYDSNNGLLSNIGPVSAPVTLSSENAVTLGLSNVNYDANATHWVVYRSAQVATYASPEYAKQDLGEIERVPIANTTYVDSLDPFDINTTPSPAYQMLKVTDPETDVSLYFSKFNAPPSSITAIGAFRGHLWAMSSSSPRSLLYSAQGYPEYWPSIYTISSFPLDDNDTLVTAKPVADLLVVFAKGAVLTLSGFPQVRFGMVENPRTSVLAGAPGCVGVRACTAVEMNGVPYVAWVAHNGIYITNGTTYRLISSDMDWDTVVSQANLSSASLHWDEDNLILWFNFDSAGGGANDKEMPVHLDPTHQKSSGLPKLAAPTSKATNCVASGLVSGTHFRYSGHPSDGKVYLEESGDTDAATGSNVALSVKTGRVYDEDSVVAVNRCKIHTTAAGAGRTATVNVQTGFDSTQNTQSVSRSVSLAEQGSKTFLVGRAGEWVEFHISDTGAGAFGITDIRAELRGMDYAGKVET